ncbi:hypothetical protein [Xanthomonas albilineans]|nr:hypothetical protein [Xanthomonas albilineans]
MQIDVLSLARVQRKRRFRRRIGLLFVAILAMTALLALVFARDLSW